MTDRRRRLPSVDALINDADVRAAHPGVSRARLVDAVRRALAAARRSRMDSEPDWPQEIGLQLHDATGDRLRPVINATGVILHTNLGRAPLARAAREAVLAAGGYGALELDLDSGVRSDRGGHARRLVRDLAECEDALVVNNAAAALLLSVNTAALGRPVAVSRGELLEIGGNFRIASLLTQAGASVLEIGSTNRTHLGDYAAAIGAGAAAILVVHRSNFEQTGFVATPAVADVVALAHEHEVPVIHDIGSGLAMDLSPWGLTGEPTVQEAVRHGADAVIASADKLLGGPQAGLVMGRAELLGRMRRNPLARAMRCDKLTITALESTLELYADGIARSEIPVLAMLTATREDLVARAERLARSCGPTTVTQLVPGHSQVGGGAFPHAQLDTMLVAVGPGALGADAVALRLRLGPVPVIALVRDGRVLLDPRTIADPEVDVVGQQVRAALADE